MYGLNRLKSAVSPAATCQKRLFRFSSLFRSIHSKHSSSAAIDYFVYVGKGSRKSRRNDRSKTYKRKVLPPELTCESAAEGGVCDVYLVGTNHYSAKFAQKAKAVIEFLKPQFGKFGAVEVLNGAEFNLAYEEAMKYGAKVVLGDRPHEISMQRTLANISLWQMIKLLPMGLFGAVCSPSPEYCTKKMSKMDDGDMLPPAFQEMSKRCPAFMETFLHERDQYMSATLLRVAREHNSVVAIVGRAHLVGIQKNWKQPVDLKKLLSMPSEKKRIPVGNILFYVGATVCIISAIYHVC
ncbi:hypothetical protein C2S52_008125 [Perilla frutescens var. hirtella]|nr:hypothetical protein C2S52_008125 [Perilla frutescens var. hirtella]